jgi:hypothetical protein
MHRQRLRFPLAFVHILALLQSHVSSIRGAGVVGRGQDLARLASANPTLRRRDTTSRWTPTRPCPTLPLPFVEWDSASGSTAFATRTAVSRRARRCIGTSTNPAVAGGASARGGVMRPSGADDDKEKPLVSESRVVCAVYEADHGERRHQKKEEGGKGKGSEQADEEAAPHDHPSQRDNKRASQTRTHSPHSHFLWYLFCLDTICNIHTCRRPFFVFVSSCICTAGKGKSKHKPTAFAICVHMSIHVFLSSFLSLVSSSSLPALLKHIRATIYILPLYLLPIYLQKHPNHPRPPPPFLKAKKGCHRLNGRRRRRRRA